MTSRFQFNITVSFPALKMFLIRWEDCKIHTQCYLSCVMLLLCFFLHRCCWMNLFCISNSFALFCQVTIKYLQLEKHFLCYDVVPAGKHTFTSSFEPLTATSSRCIVYEKEPFSEVLIHKYITNKWYLLFPKMFLPLILTYHCRWMRVTSYYFRLLYVFWRSVQY